MRIGLNGGASSIERMIEQARTAEADGFSSLWYPSAIAGDPVTAMAVAGRATTSIELGTAVLQSYTSHPVLQANRMAGAAFAMGRPGLTLGIGPSHAPVIDGMYGMSYATPGRHSEAYVEIVTALLRGERVDVDGPEYTVRGVQAQAAAFPVQVLVAALAPRLLRVAGAVGDGTILWMANARAIEAHVAPCIAKAAADAGASVILSNHSEYDNAYTKARLIPAKREAGENHPFIVGADSVQRYFTVMTECATASKLRAAAK